MVLTTVDRPGRLRHDPLNARQQFIGVMRSSEMHQYVGFMDHFPFVGAEMLSLLLQFESQSLCVMVKIQTLPKETTTLQTMLLPAEGYHCRLKLALTLSRRLWEGFVAVDSGYHLIGIKLFHSDITLVVLLKFHMSSLPFLDWKVKLREVCQPRLQNLENSQ